MYIVCVFFISRQRKAEKWGMWNVLRHQIRNYVDNLRKQKEAEANGPKLSITKVPVQITIQHGLAAPSQVLWGYAFLNDITPAGIYVFSPETFPKDQQVSITLEQPRRFFANARVISAQNTKTDSKVISEARPTHRLALEYIIQSDDERQAFQQFAEEIARDHLYKRKAA